MQKPTASACSAVQWKHRRNTTCYKKPLLSLQCRRTCILRCTLGESTTYRIELPQRVVKQRSEPTPVKGFRIDPCPAADRSRVLYAASGVCKYTNTTALSRPRRCGRYAAVGTVARKVSVSRSRRTIHGKNNIVPRRRLVFVLSIVRFRAVLGLRLGLSSRLSGSTTYMCMPFLSLTDAKLLFPGRGNVRRYDDE